MRKIAIITIVLTLLVLLAMPSKASPLVFEDEKGDVAKFDLATENVSYVSKSGVDITRLVYYQSSTGMVQISLTVDGEIDPNVVYTISFNTTDGNKKVINYVVTYSENEELQKNLGNLSEIVNAVVATLIENGSVNNVTKLDPKFEKFGKNKLRVTFNLLSPNESLRDVAVLTYGWDLQSYCYYVDSLNCTVEQSQPQQTDNENQTQPSNDENQQNNGGIPGFEAILLLPAILIALLILRNKKNL